MPKYTYDSKEFNSLLIATLEDLLDHPSVADRDSATKLLAALPKDNLIRKFYEPHLDAKQNVPDYSTSSYAPGSHNLEHIDEEKPLRHYLRGIASTDIGKKKARLVKSWEKGFLPAGYKLLEDDVDEKSRLEKLQILAAQGYPPALADLGADFLKKIRAHLDDEQYNFSADGTLNQYYDYITNATYTGNKKPQEAFRDFLAKLLLICKSLQDAALPDIKRKNIKKLLEITEDMANYFYKQLLEKQKLVKGIEPDFLNNELIFSVIPTLKSIAPDNLVDPQSLNSFITPDFLQSGPFRERLIGHLIAACAAPKIEARPDKTPKIQPGSHRTAIFPPKSKPLASSTNIILKQTKAPLPRSASSVPTSPKSPSGKHVKRKRADAIKKQVVISGMIGTGSLFVGALVGIGISILGVALVLSGAFSPILFAAAVMGLALTLSPAVATVINIALALTVGVICAAAATVIPMVLSSVVYAVSTKIASAYRSRKVDFQYTALDLDGVNVVPIKLDVDHGQPPSSLHLSPSTPVNPAFITKLDDVIGNRKKNR